LSGESRTDASTLEKLARRLRSVLVGRGETGSRAEDGAGGSFGTCLTWL